MTRVVAASVLGSVFALAGCEGCKRQPPPVEFQSAVDAQWVAPSDDASRGVADAQADVPRFVPREGAVFESAQAEITVDGQRVLAPNGERFVATLVTDLNGDGVSDDVVAARVSPDGAAAGLSLYRRSAEGFAVESLDDAAPGDRQCARAQLRQSAPGSLSVVWRCELRAADAGLVTRDEGAEALWVAPGTPSRVRGRARITPGPGFGTALAITAEGVDRDGDGNDELVVTVSAGRPEARPMARAQLVYFERGGALVRDTAEPAASLRAAVEGARRALARRRSGASEALQTLDDLVRLRRALCTATGLARVEVAGQRGVPCAPPEGAEQRARALVALGELPAALAVVSGEAGDDWGAVTERVRTELTRAAALDRRAVSREGPPAGAPLDTLAPFRSGVLRFESAANPVAVALHGPATGRADVATLAFAAGEGGSVDEIAPVAGGLRLVGAAERCEGLGVVFCPEGAAGCYERPWAAGATTLPEGAVFRALGELPSVETARRCVASAESVQTLGPGALTVLGTNRQGWLVARHRRLLRVGVDGGVARLSSGDSLGAVYAPGGAVSESGAAAALVDLRGVWLRERTGWKLVAPATLDGRFSQLHDLTVSNDGRLVAGLLGNNLVVVERTRR
ncbi:MAG: hypothetical protein JNK72_24425 [Myxococcales bacterium]|nr:hypothetical protein [Myxococcales bacterium]